METAQCALAAEVLRAAGTLSLRVFGGSMLPSIWPGDILTLRRAHASDIHPGKLVLYARDNGFVVHRAVRCNRDALITRGDALRGNDAPVQPSRVLGEVVAIQRGRSRLIPRERLNRALKLFRWLLRRSGRLRGLAMRLYSLRQAELVS
jgi:signal peptidase I